MKSSLLVWEAELCNCRTMNFDKVFKQFLYEFLLFEITMTTEDIMEASEHYQRSGHGLRTPNEGINQRNLKFWADVADKICFGRT